MPGDGLADMIKEEVRIQWVEDISRYDYVRVVAQAFPRRRGRPSIGHWGRGARLIGWSEVSDRAEAVQPGWFHRRVFHVLDDDRSETPDSAYAPTGCPMEAVDPRTVAPGVAGEVTRRAWGCDNQPDRPHHAGGSCPLCGRTWPTARDA